MNTPLCIPRQVSTWLNVSVLGLAFIGALSSTSFAGGKSHLLNETAVLQSLHSAGGDAFGFAVDIERDIAVVGAAEDSEQDVQSGAVYIFQRNASGGWIETAKLFANDPGPCRQFGSSVALDGNTLAIGQRGVHRGGCARS